MARSRRSHFLILLISHILAFRASAMRFEIQSGLTKCFGEELLPNAIVVGNYAVVMENASNISASVTSPYGDSLHYQDGVDRGSFAFTATNPGSHVMCFWSASPTSGEKINVEFEMKTGVEAKDWTNIAKREKIDGIQLELRRLEAAVEAIHEEMLYLRDREMEMRNVNEVTNSRMAWFTMTSLFVCLVVAGLQLWYLKTFFEKKKLI